MKLVLVDTWGRFRPARRGKAPDLYAQDYTEIFELKQLIDSHGIACILVHHLNQARDAEHWTERFLGTTGVIGGPDTLLALARTPNGVVLRAIGRDVPETELAVTFENYRWHILGPAEDVQLSEARRQIIEALDLLGGATPKELSEYTDRPPSTVRRLLAALHREDRVLKMGSRYHAIKNNLVRGEVVMAGCCD